MAKSIKSNFIYNIIHTVSGLLFPLITFPYASRVIMAEGIGQVHFFTSIISYVVLFTNLGIPTYAIREIARVRDNQKELSKTATEILTLNLILTFIGYLAIAVMCFYIPKVQADIPLFLLLSLSIILTTIGCHWFYSGIEEFKYVAIRGLIVKTACVVLLFALVRTKDDLMWYATYTIFGSIGNNIINFLRLRKFVSFKDFYIKEINPWRHLKPALAIFIFNLVTSVYLHLDTVMLGSMKEPQYVGYYTSATKLTHLFVTLVTTLGGVMLPRLSNLIKNGNMDEFYRLSHKSYNFVTFISFPICAGLISFAPILIPLFSGESFMPAVLTLQIMSPIIIAIGISNLIGMQILYPQGKIKLVTLSTCVGALVNFSLNCILIPRFAQNGAAIATVFAEISVTITQFIIAKKYIPFNLFNKSVLSYVSASIIMFIVLSLVRNIQLMDILKLGILFITGGAVYILCLICVMDNQCFEILKMIKTKVNRP